MARSFLSTKGLTHLLEKLKTLYVEKEPGKVLSTNDFTTEDKQKLDGLKNYELPQATQEVLGGVTVGEGLDVAEGKISVSADVKAKWENVQDKPETFQPAEHEHTADEVTGLADVATSGNYSDLTGAPTNVSTFTNDAGYQKAADVASAIAAAGHLKRQIVERLPEVDAADANTIYMVLNSVDGKTGNLYLEYMVIEGKWEKIGTSDTDLTGYLKVEDISEITDEEIDALFV